MKGITKILLELKSVDLDTVEGFLYTSGRKGPIYCDNRLLLSHPEERNGIVEAFLGLIREKELEFDVVAGVATGAIAWGAIIADRLKKPFVYVRASAKEHGKQNQIEGELEEGKKVLVIEDLINTGGSSVSACQAVQSAGCKVTACLAIFSYGFKDAEKKFSDAKVPLFCLSDFDELLATASSEGAITEEEKKELLRWHGHPEGWEPRQ
ncbi:orotate phosphoribosyltransferase [Candidatus Woesearchaeota archaeon]|nr:orotate phosphoribosyltransferase [Candidatus Woesearchaeota archaeon]